jgi:hypothetical protein
MKVRWSVLSVVAMLCASTAVDAAIIIPTNLGKGADAELRESDTGVGLSGVAEGINRGANTELATRADDKVTIDNTTTPPSVSNYFPTNDRSSVMLLKFDIGALPAAGDSFWNDKQVNLRLHVRQNNNITGQRLWNTVPGGVATNLADYRLMNFGIRGLEPGATYVDDGAAALKKDRVGNDWNATQYNYDWNEAGVTFYNAPGITPHCVLSDSCADPNIPNTDATSLTQTLGKYDDFDANTREIDDTWHWPNETTAAGYTGTTTLPAALTGGTPIDYRDPSGNLKQLLLDAKVAGRDTITLMVHHNLVATQNQPTVGIVGTTPGAFLAQNYLVAPKELTTLPSGTVTDNSLGLLSPLLLIFVPEPTSVVLQMLGATTLGVVRRRKYV